MWFDGKVLRVDRNGVAARGHNVPQGFPHIFTLVFSPGAGPLIETHAFIAIANMLGVADAGQSLDIELAALNSVERHR